LCRACQVEGQITAAREVDHVVRIEEGGEAWGPANLQSLCKAHHSLKTAQYDLKGKDWRQWETRDMAFSFGGREPHCACRVTPKDGGFFERPFDDSNTYHYRGYEIVPQHQWASWCVGIDATRADLPLMSRSTLRTLSSRKEEAVAEAKHSIDEALAQLDDWN
jgi:hypothetical protein